MVEASDRDAATITIEHPQAVITIDLQPEGQRFVSVTPKNLNLFVSRREWLTSYPEKLIRLILEVKGPDYLCDEIARDEDPDYVQHDLLHDIEGYFDRKFFEGKRMLDFGCGSGASTAILAREFPSSEIVGVELFPDLLSAARARVAHYSLDNVQLLKSPSGTELPSGLGEFDFVIMSAVFEHLLPAERRSLTPRVWAVIKSGGHLFLNQTPNLWCPVEGHTTGLPLINYLPTGLSIQLAKRLAADRVGLNPSDEELLRMGLRGATEREIMRALGPEAVLLEPSRNGMRDRVDLWFSALSAEGHRTIKNLARIAQKVTWTTCGFTLMPNLTMVVRKS